MSRVNIKRLQEMAEVEFADIVMDTIPGLNELRIILTDGSFIDAWFSLKLQKRYSYHWERKVLDGTIYRHDNAPHQRWQEIKTFPKHFHDGDEEQVTESHLPNDPELALRQVLTFARKRLKQIDQR